jgi:integrase
MKHAVPAAEAAYVRQGRALFETVFPNAVFPFEAPSWDIRPLRTSQHKKTNSWIYFTLHSSNVDPLPPRFSNVVKAYILLNKGASATMILRADIARLLWEAVRPRFGEADAFDWGQLTEDDLLRTEQVMLIHWSQSTTYKRCTQLQYMMRALAAVRGGGIVRPMEVAFTTPRTDDSERYTLDGQVERMKRMPSDEAIRAVADIYARYAKEPADRLIACILAVMMATGLRIGETLTLPLDSICSEGAGAKKRWGIRYHKEKLQGGQKQLAVRWMTPKQVELATTAIKEARAITGPARAQASVLETTPDRVRLPGHRWNEMLRVEEVASLLGMTIESVDRISPPKLPRKAAQHGGPKDFEYRTSDVAAFLYSRRVPDLWVVDRRDGTKQKLSESLFVVFRNFGHKQRQASRFLVEPLTEQTVNDFLGGRTERERPIVRSAFERFGLTDSAGNFFKMHSHQFRHWVTTKAAIAGVPDEVIARWQGREHIGDLEAYKHLTPGDRVATLRAALESGRTKGRVAEMYFSLHDDVRDAFLEGQLQAVHVTPLGLCVHDFKVSPCPKMLNCVKDCDDYLFDTTNQVHRQNLIQLRTRTQHVLQHAEAQKSRSGVDLSENWIADAKATLAGVERILAADSTGGAPIVRPHAGRASRFQAPVKD